jgi:hypothetical protein
MSRNLDERRAGIGKRKPPAKRLNEGGIASRHIRRRGARVVMSLFRIPFRRSSSRPDLRRGPGALSSPSRGRRSPRVEAPALSAPLSQTWRSKRSTSAGTPKANRATAPERRRRTGVREPSALFRVGDIEIDAERVEARYCTFRLAGSFSPLAPASS